MSHINLMHVYGVQRSSTILVEYIIPGKTKHTNKANLDQKIEIYLVDRSAKMILVLEKTYN